MKILYQSSLCTEEVLKKLYKDSDISPGIQAQKYNKLIVEGMNLNNQEIFVLSALPVNRSISKKFFVLKKSEIHNNIKYYYYPAINIPIVKDLFVLIFSFIKTASSLLLKKDSIVMCDLLSLPNSLGATLAARVLRKDSIGILTDLPEYVISTKSKFFLKLYYWLINLQNKYVFLTKEMNEKINHRNKKNIIIEGWCDIKRINNNVKKKNYILYSGNLNKNNGIQNLVAAFLEIQSQYQLIIFGSGDYDSELRKLTLENNNITYYGFANNDIVLKYQEESRILAIPRPLDEEFVKYSFPSKLIEYMQSGSAIITTKLPGIPSEYDRYLYFFDSPDIIDLKQGLERLIARPELELDAKGLTARDFIIKNKNNVIQAKKIIELIKE